MHKRSRAYEKTLPVDSNFGNFEAELISKNDSWLQEYAKVHIDCCNYEFYKKLCEAVQPILNELTKEMNKDCDSDE